MTEDAPNPPLVLESPTTGIEVTRQDRFDTYRGAADGPRPAVVFVPGPVPPSFRRPRDSAFYAGYARLAADRGALAVLPALHYESLAEVPTATAELADLVTEVRALPGVDPDRIAIWAFSGGGLLIGRWLAESPAWLRVLAMTYPLPAGEPVVPGRPIVLTRVGRELPDRQAEVDAFLARAKTAGADVRVIDVPDGRHGFDVFDDTDQSRAAIAEALHAVTALLTA